MGMRTIAWYVVFQPSTHYAFRYGLTTLLALITSILVVTIIQPGAGVCLLRCNAVAKCVFQLDEAAIFSPAAVKEESLESGLDQILDLIRQCNAFVC